MTTQHTQINLDYFYVLLKLQYIALFESDPDYAFAASRTTPAKMARKITLELDQGTANKEGKGVKNVCKELNIKHTYKAIHTFLTAK